ncbi:MAG TPA: alkene reductase [Rhizomicrobium sp.]|nr:alkene reductase [Rhizomicrobium sp.]
MTGEQRFEGSRALDQHRWRHLGKLGPVKPIAGWRAFRPDGFGGVNGGHRTQSPYWENILQYAPQTRNRIRLPHDKKGQIFYYLACNRPEASPMTDDSKLMPLFDPLKIGNLHLPHRIAMAPMTRFRCNEDGIPAPYVSEYYAQRSSAALIVCESVYTIPSGRIAPLAGGLITEPQRTAWAAVASAVHAKGGRIFLQLIHGGRVSHPLLQPGGVQPIAPSAVLADDKVRLAQGFVAPVVPRAMEISEIHEVIESFAVATRHAAEAGFDGVELHAGNGYLPCQFLSSNTNLRQDDYGGTLTNRLRFVMETLEAMCAVRSPDFVGVKISPGFRYHDARDEAPEETYTELAKALGKMDLAYTHIQIPLDFIQPEGAAFDPVALVRNHYRGVLLAGGNLDRRSAAHMIATGAADVAVFGRRFIANPDLPERFRLGAGETELDPDTLHVPGHKGYIDYPTLRVAGEPH